MNLNVDCVILHGIAETIDKNYFTPFKAGIIKYLGNDSKGVRFHETDYSYLLAKQEELIFTWMSKFGWQKSRKWACNFVVDILALTQKDRPLEPGDYYYDLFKLFTERYDTINSFYPDSRKVLIGHSLGGQLGFGLTWRRHFDTLITMGSPITWFSPAFKNCGQMNPDLKLWYNFWKKYDRVASTISENPNFKMVYDIQVKSFNPLNLLTAKAHSAYWKDEFVYKTIAEILLKSTD